MATTCCCGGHSVIWFATALRRAQTPACRPRVFVRGDIVNNDAHLVFEDNGPGFTAESLAKVFQPFATTKANGTVLAWRSCRR